MKVIVCGTRGVGSLSLVRLAMRDSGFDITEVLCGGCRGPDLLAAAWAEDNGIPVRWYRPDWAGDGKRAGPLRNEEMAKDADALIAVWDGKSRGTMDMIDRGRKHGLKVYVYPWSDGSPWS